jgi:hypothetical protein
MPSLDTDRNLLFGALALQLGVPDSEERDEVDAAPGNGSRPRMRAQPASL